MGNRAGIDTGAAAAVSVSRPVTDARAIAALLLLLFVATVAAAAYFYQAVGASALLLAWLLLGCGWWLARRRSDEETRQRLSRTVRLLSNCGRALVEAESEQALLDAVCRLVVESGGYRFAWIGVPSHDADCSVRIASRYGVDQGYLEETPVSWAGNEAGRGPTGVAIRERRTQVIHDLRSNPSLALWRDAALRRGFASCLSVPLSLGKELFGAMTVYGASPNAFGDDEVALLEDLARDIAHGIGALRLRVAHLAAEEELRLSEERMRGLFGSINDALFVHGLRPDGKPGRFVEVNDVACRRLGYTREELLTRSPLDIDAPGCDDMGAVVRRLMTDGSTVFETVHVAKDGRLLPVEISSSTFMLRGKRMFVSLARDITERRRYEQERIEAEHQLSTLSAHLVAARENERAIIARELHDELGQVLTALKMDISTVKRETRAQTGIAEKLDGMTGLVDQTLGTVRRIAADLRPTMIDDLGLPAAIEWLVEEFVKRHSHIDCKLVLDFGRHEVGEAYAIAAYRVVQECLTNVARHAQATKLHVVLGIRAGQELMISVQDNGRGLDPHSAGGFGLLGMRQRVQALGGKFSAETIPGEGVVIDVSMPMAGLRPTEVLP